MAAVAALFEGRAEIGVVSRDPHGRTAPRLFWGRDPGALSDGFWETLVEGIHLDGTLLTDTRSGVHCGALALESSELRGEELILVFSAEQPVQKELYEAVSTLARIFGNQIRLLDYSELDSLTRLLNRKTFDETFDRLLTSSSARSGDGTSHERRTNEDESPAWLCVVDIDHFKRINDSFGHLFGDEVLLRIGDLMRKTFRDGDRLFRFGGEEFVVILNAPDETLAAAGFERLRSSVEKNEFPQVGKVTCSIGFTRVLTNDVPTDVVGRADAALYFAKGNGRNQVCCYEQLLAQGAIAKSEPDAAKVADDFDIDALFG